MKSLRGLASDLLDGLAEAEKLALEDKETGGREGALEALTAVCAFVMGASERLSNPRDRAAMLGRKAVLDDLAFALIGLRHGTVAPIITKQPIHNRAHLETNVAIARGYAAAAMEVLIRSGIPAEQAARKIASWIAGRPESVGIKRNAERPAWKAVQRWRTDIMAAQHRPSWDAPGLDILIGADVATFDEMMRQYAQLLAQGKGAVEQQRLFAKLMLDQGRVMLSQKGPS